MEKTWKPHPDRDLNPGPQCWETNVLTANYSQFFTVLKEITGDIWLFTGMSRLAIGNYGKN